MIAAKHLDPILGIDIHLIITPAAVVVPIPHPYIGIVFDPMDYVPIIGATVEVNGLKRAQAGTSGMAIVKHFPIGGTFAKPPSNESEVFMGSKTVLADGDPLSRLGLPVLSCQDIGLKAPVRTGKPSKTFSLVLPFSVVLSIPLGKPVLVGGPPTVSLMALAMRGIMAGLGWAFRKLASTNIFKRVVKQASDKLHKAGNKLADALNLSQNARNKIHRALCNVTGHPVDVATGKVFTEAIDLRLPGILPLRWNRLWLSCSEHDGPLGRGWYHSFDIELFAADEVHLVRLADGRCVYFPPLEDGERAEDVSEGMVLARCGAEYVLTDRARREHVFGLSGAQKPVPGFERIDRYRLLTVRDGNGNRIGLAYDERGLLTEIIDSAQRSIAVENDDAGRIVGLLVPHPTQLEQRCYAVRYVYDAVGNLIRVIDANGNVARYQYSDHLLICETDRRGLSFYFEYDGTGPTARCVRTFGDGGLYERSLQYDEVAQTTTVLDSRGGKTVLHVDGRGLVSLVIDPLGVQTQCEYDEQGRMIAQTRDGRTTTWSYDEQGNLCAHQSPSGIAAKFEHDTNGRLTKISYADGTQSCTSYDERGNRIETVDRAGARTQFERDLRGCLTTLVQPGGIVHRFRYNDEGMLSEWHDADGGLHRYGYDRLGRRIEETDAQNQHFVGQYDLKGQLIHVDYPDGNQLEQKFDGEWSIVEQRYADGRSFSYRYGGRGRLLERTDPSGTVIIERDRDEAVIAIKNPRGETYHYRRDILGRVVETIAFDGRVRRYGYGNSAACTSITELGDAGAERSIRYERDAADALLRVLLPSGEAHEFSYDEVGRLVAATTPLHQVTFAYDRAGRIIEEGLDGDLVRSEFDGLGRRSRRIAASGREVVYQHSPGGKLLGLELRDSSVADHGLAQIRYRYDARGACVEQRLPGDIAVEYRYDDRGRVCERIRKSRLRHTRTSRQYDAQGRLRRVKHEALGAMTFAHNNAGQLSTISPDGEPAEIITYDANGSITRRGDRQYQLGRGDRIAAQNGAPYQYNAYGDLVQPCVDGRGQRYHYNELHQLTAVCDAEGRTVASYEYDALGRRVCKRSDKTCVRYGWDGLALLSEQRSDGQREYLSYGFVPIAQWIDRELQIYETDPLGTPIGLLDQEGHVLWEGLPHPYGNFARERGSARPAFALPGQFVDEESGLLYCLNRYYDPVDGRFTTPDPLNLDGGTNAYAYVHNPLVQIDPLGFYGNQIETPYGADDLSAKAVEHRAKNSHNGLNADRNVAVLEYTDGNGKTDHIYGVSSKEADAERHALEDFKKMQAENPGVELNRLYTEREPCSKNRDCTSFLKENGIPESKVNYHFVNNAENLGEKSLKEAKKETAQEINKAIKAYNDTCG